MRISNIYTFIYTSVHSSVHPFLYLSIHLYVHCPRSVHSPPSVYTKLDPEEHQFGFSWRRPGPTPLIFFFRFLVPRWSLVAFLSATAACVRDKWPIELKPLGWKVCLQAISYTVISKVRCITAGERPASGRARRMRNLNRMSSVSMSQLFDDKLTESGEA